MRLSRGCQEVVNYLLEKVGEVTARGGEDAGKQEPERSALAADRSGMGCFTSVKP